MSYKSNALMEDTQDQMIIFPIGKVRLKAILNLNGAVLALPGCLGFNNNNTLKP
jgi:hypothetical protein